MCGIAGIIKLQSGDQAEPEVLRNMLQRIIHRGPDDNGMLVDGELAMGMRRLSIIDLQDGRQPIQNEDGRFSVILNGEIYNYIELRKSLESKGHQFRTQSDTEVIVHLFEEYGEGCVDHLRGMFAFAIWDHHQRELFLFRDRMGIKPLYYIIENDRITFGSEIKSLLTVPGVRPSVDLEALSEYLALKYVPAPRTMFEGVRSLPPGYKIVIRNGKVEIKQYWEMSFANKHQYASEEECVDALMEKLHESVKLRLRADVPFGAFLSGGLDSSTIVALMSNVLDEPVNTFSVGFADLPGRDELPFARQVAEQFNCNHREILVGANDFLLHAEKVMWHLEQPIADQATVATYMVAKLAREHVKMVLTGEGGDELFAGYARYVGQKYGWPLSCMPRPIKSTIRYAVEKLPGLRRQKIAINALTQNSEVARISNWFPLFKGDLKTKVVTDLLKPLVSKSVNSVASYLNRCDAKNSLDRMLYVDSKAWLSDYLLLRGDKLTMANSLEGRVPLLDHELVEFACSLPTQYKLKGRTRKYLLKKAAAKLLPEKIINRKKQGFPIPIEKWLRNDANEMMRDLLSDDCLRRRGFFEPNVVNNMISSHESGYADYATELWGLMSVELWMRQFLDSSPQKCEPQMVVA